LHAVNAKFVWAYDFVFDATAGGQRIKCLTAVDKFAHEWLSLE
jgi:putative transposase